MKGWTGKVLRVDLSSGSAAAEPLREDWARQYIGSRGLGVRYLFEEVDPRVDPFSPENRLYLVTGPLTGTSASCASRWTAVTKGPLTGAVATSNSGGQWAAHLKFAGYDMVILEGRAASPCYIWIDDGRAEIRDASRLWGKGIWETEELIKEELGTDRVWVAGIGPAGENRVRFASIMNDKYRAAGRSGVGAVMGSKNVKAIAVRGRGAVEVADPEAFHRAVWRLKRLLKENPVTGQGLPTYGTEVLMNIINEVGALPTRNFRQSQFEGAYEISGENLAETRLVRNTACFACTIGCGRLSRISRDGVTRVSVWTSPRHWSAAAEGPEYENAWGLGAETGVSDLDAVVAANSLCNDYGMDPISFGATLGAAMELYESGVITEAEIGMPLPFGSSEALVRMAEATAFRRGFGDALAEGAKRLTERYGRPEFFMGVKGQEFPAYDPRSIQGMGLTYATSNRGACHLKSYTVASEVLGIPEKTDPLATQGKAELVRVFQDLTAWWDSTGLCLFLVFAPVVEVVAEVLSAGTGIPYSQEELMKAGERVFNLEREWIARAGFSTTDDTLPRRLLEEPVPAGPTQGQVNRLREMLDDYYRIRGWEGGRPTRAKLQELGIPA